jgi:predicted ester cyclase
MSEENKALIRRMLEEGMNMRNLALLDELLDPGYVYHGVVEGEIKGVEAMKQFLTSLYAVWPDVQHVIQEQVAEGDKVVTRFKSIGTSQVEFMGIAPSGKQVTVDEVSISRIAGGRIVEDWNTWDFLGLLRQLGAAPQSTEANKALFRRVCEEEDKGNINILDEVCAPDYAMHFAGNPKPLTRDEHKQIARAFYAAFPDIRHNIEDLIAVDDKVVARMTYPGTHRGEWQGIAPTGKHVAYDAVVIARITGRKIVEMWALLDLLSLMQQLGAAPPLGGHDIAREAVFNAAKAAYSAYGGLLKDVAQEMGMEKAVALHAKRCQAFYVALAGVTRDRLGASEFDLNALSSALKDVNNTIFGCTFEPEEEPGSLTFKYFQCPIYEGFRSAGLDHEAIELICTGGESSGLAEMKKALPQLSCALRFRSAPDQPCVQEFVFG